MSCSRCQEQLCKSAFSKHCVKCFACTSHEDPLWHACCWTGAACSTGTNAYELEHVRDSVTNGRPNGYTTSDDNHLSKQAKILGAQPLASGPQTRPTRSEFFPFSSHHLTSPSFQVLARVALPHLRLPLLLDPLPHSLEVRHLLTCSVSHPTLTAQPPLRVCFGPEAPPGFTQFSFSLRSNFITPVHPLRRVSLGVDWVFTMPNVNPTSMSLANSQNWLNYWKHASRMMINSVV